MQIFESRTFKSGDDVAVLLPDGLGFAPDIAVTIECHGDVLTIRPALESDKEQRELMALIAELETLPEIEKREPIEFPDRPGLY